MTEESIASVNAAKASSLGDISDATTQAINALDNAIGEVPLEDADDLRYTIAENATSPTTKAYAVGEYFYYGLTDDNKSDLCRVTKAIASGDTIYKTGANKNCESVTKGIANAVNKEVADLKSTIQNSSTTICVTPTPSSTYIYGWRGRTWDYRGYTNSQKYMGSIKLMNEEFLGAYKVTVKPPTGKFAMVCEYSDDSPSVDNNCLIATYGNRVIDEPVSFLFKKECYYGIYFGVWNDSDVNEYLTEEYCSTIKVECETTYTSLNYVSYRMFGAKLDGKTDDSSAIENAHIFANKMGIPVIEHNGIIKGNFHAIVKTDVDLRGTTIEIDDDIDALYDVQHDVTADITSAFGTAYAETTSKSSLFGKYGVLTCQCDSYLLGSRDVEDRDWYIYQPIAVDDNGNIITTPIVTPTVNYEIDPETGETTETVVPGNILEVSSLYENSVKLKFGRVVFNGSGIGYPTVVKINRNNVTLDGMEAVYTKEPGENANNVQLLIEVRFCCNAVIKNVHVENHSNNNGNNIYSYALLVDQCYNVVVEKCMFMNGWGAIQTSAVDSITFRDCVVNRFDNHWCSYGGFNIINCVLVGSGRDNSGEPGDITLGWGCAHVYIENLRYVGNYKKSIVIFRKDFNESFWGTLRINGFTTELNALKTRFVLVNNAVSDEQQRRPKIILEHINLIGAITGEFVKTTNRVPGNIEIELIDCKGKAITHDSVAPIKARIINSEIYGRVYFDSLEAISSKFNITNENNAIGKALLIGCYSDEEESWNFTYHPDDISWNPQNDITIVACHNITRT